MLQLDEKLRFDLTLVDYTKMRLIVSLFVYICGLNIICVFTTKKRRTVIYFCMKFTWMVVYTKLIRSLYEAYMKVIRSLYEAHTKLIRSLYEAYTKLI